jgi:hypothetical protein
MADTPPKPPPTEPIRLKVSANLRKYLGYLARKTTMGRDENDVALTVLTQQLEVMRHTPQYAFRFEDDDTQPPSSGEGS